MLHEKITMISRSPVLPLLQQVDMMPTMFQSPSWVLRVLLNIHEHDGEAPWTTHSLDCSLTVTTVLLKEVDVIPTMKPPLKFLSDIHPQAGGAPSIMLPLHFCLI
jgi:hypothetical protein